MKKLTSIFMVFALTLCMVFSACNGCSQKNESFNDCTYPVAGLNVERIIATDFEYMTVNYGGEYRWYECCIDAKDWINESDTFHVNGIANIFYKVYLNEDSTSGTAKVYLLAHAGDSFTIDSTEGIWVGDEPMNEFNPMDINFAQAYDAMMRTNCVKPHSRHCVLRKEFGPLNAAPQYIFGNQEYQVYVDAKTGKVNTDNPVFPADVNNTPIDCLNNDTTLEKLNYAFNW